MRGLLALLLSLVLPGQASARPVRVALGRSIAGIELGMTRAQVQRLGHVLAPEGIQRVERTGWTSGPLLILIDGADRVVLVSLDLRRSRGALVDGVRIGPRATLEDLARHLPGCSIEQGSGGRALTCRKPAGVLKAYDAYGGDDSLWIHLGPG